MRTKSTYIITFLLILALAATAALFVFSEARTRTAEVFADGEEGILTVHFIDCGQADACVIEFPDDKTMLIDAGEDGESSSGRVISYIKEQTDIKSFDYFVMTHSDSDHIGGVVDVLSEFPVETSFRPNQEATHESYDDPAAEADGSKGLHGDYTGKDTKTYADALAAVYSVSDDVYVFDAANDEINNITGSATVNGETFEYTFDFYSPLSDSYSDNNNYSPIMVLSYAGRNIVLSGDAEKQNEEEFVAKVRDSNDDERYDRFRRGFDADVIKMGHHGSETSSSKAYLEIMCSTESARCNTYTVFSCGRNLTYGHPRYSTLKRLVDMNFSAERIERTDKNGNIRFDIRSGGELTRTHDKDVTTDVLLTAGELSPSNSKYEAESLKTVPDNDINPTEPNGSPVTRPDPEDPGTDPENPFAFLGELTTTQIIIIIAIAVVVLIVIIIVWAAVSRRSKKKKGRRRR